LVWEGNDNEISEGGIILDKRDTYVMVFCCFSP